MILHDAPKNSWVKIVELLVPPECPPEAIVALEFPWCMTIGFPSRDHPNLFLGEGDVFQILDPKRGIVRVKVDGKFRRGSMSLYDTHDGYYRYNHLKHTEVEVVTYNGQESLQS